MSTSPKSKDNKSTRADYAVGRPRMDGKSDIEARTPSVVRPTPEGERRKAERQQNEEAAQNQDAQQAERATGSSSPAGSSDDEPRTERRRVNREGTDTNAGPMKNKTDVQGSVAGSTWVALSVGIALLVLLLIFIIQNMESVTLTVFFWTVSFPAGVGFLLAAIIGAVIMLSVGSVRMLQLRRQIHQQRK